MGQVTEKQIIEADTNGRLVLPDASMREIKPHTRYVVEAHGDGLVIYPEVPVLMDQETEKLTFDEWQQQWEELQARMSLVSKTDKSAAEIIAEMRR